MTLGKMPADGERRELAGWDLALAAAEDFGVRDTILQTIGSCNGPQPVQRSPSGDPIDKGQAYAIPQEALGQRSVFESYRFVGDMWILQKVLDRRLAEPRIEVQDLAEREQELPFARIDRLVFPNDDEQSAEVLAPVGDGYGHDVHRNGQTNGPAASRGSEYVKRDQI
jgi:hypothetical protein